MVSGSIPHKWPNLVISYPGITPRMPLPRELLSPFLRGTNPIPRWDVHFGGLDEDRKDSTAPHIRFRPQLGGHR